MSGDPYFSLIDQFLYQFSNYWQKLKIKTN